jgi:glycosyltransferase involved in cell wall biosynthesis
MEAMPIAWLEGLATGKAVVASQTGPGPEVIDDGVTGVLCEPHDPDSIAARVISLLRDAPARRRLGAAARRMAVERYSLEMLVKRNLDYYARIAKPLYATRPHIIEG